MQVSLYSFQKSKNVVNGLRFFSKFSYILPIREREITLIFIKLAREEELNNSITILKESSKHYF